MSVRLLSLLLLPWCVCYIIIIVIITQVCLSDYYWHFYPGVSVRSGDEVDLGEGPPPTTVRLHHSLLYSFIMILIIVLSMNWFTRAIFLKLSLT